MCLSWWRGGILRADTLSGDSLEDGWTQNAGKGGFVQLICLTSTLPDKAFLGQPRCSYSVCLAQHQLYLWFSLPIFVFPSRLQLYFAHFYIPRVLQSN